MEILSFILGLAVGRLVFPIRHPGRLHLRQGPLDLHWKLRRDWFRSVLFFDLLHEVLIQHLVLHLLEILQIHPSLILHPARF